MKIIKKYCKDSSRGREVVWGRGRPQTRYLNRIRRHPKPVQCCGKPPSYTTCLCSCGGIIAVKHLVLNVTYFTNAAIA